MRMASASLSSFPLYLIPEINQETKERNEATLKRAQEIRAERVLHPETIPEKGHLMVVPDIPNDDSPEVIDWIQTYMEWMDGNPEYSKRTVEQTQYLQERMKEFLKAKRRPHITLMKFDKTWFKAFFLWLKNDYVPQKYVRVKAKPLSNASLRNMQQRIVAVFNKAVKTGKLKANPFYQLEKEDTISSQSLVTSCTLHPMNSNSSWHPKRLTESGKPSWHLASLALQDYASAT